MVLIAKCYALHSKWRFLEMPAFEVVLLSSKTAISRGMGPKRIKSVWLWKKSPARRLAKHCFCCRRFCSQQLLRKESKRVWRFSTNSPPGHTSWRFSPNSLQPTCVWGFPPNSNCNSRLAIHTLQLTLCNSLFAIHTFHFTRCNSHFSIHAFQRRFPFLC